MTIKVENCGVGDLLTLKTAPKVDNYKLPGYNPGLVPLISGETLSPGRYDLYIKPYDGNLLSAPVKVESFGNEKGGRVDGVEVKFQEITTKLRGGIIFRGE